MRASGGVPQVSSAVSRGFCFPMVLPSDGSRSAARMSPRPMVRVLCSHLQAQGHDGKVLFWVVPRRDGTVLGSSLWHHGAQIHILALTSSFLDTVANW